VPLSSPKTRLSARESSPVRRFRSRRRSIPRPVFDANRGHTPTREGVRCRSRARRSGFARGTAAGWITRRFGQCRRPTRRSAGGVRVAELVVFHQPLFVLACLILRDLSAQRRSKQPCPSPVGVDRPVRPTVDTSERFHDPRKNQVASASTVSGEIAGLLR
jgi:hypothetical protein